MSIHKTSPRRGPAQVLLGVGLAAGLLAVPVSASAAPTFNLVSGSATGNVGRDHIRLTLLVSNAGHVGGYVSYYDGHRWLTSTRVGALKVSGSVAKVKGEARWNGRDVIYYLQVKDRSPKRADTISMKVKDGKQVVLRQSAPVSTGDLIVH